MIKSNYEGNKSGSQLVDIKLAGLEGWQGEVLRHIRKLIHQAIPDVEEDCKWAKSTNPMGVPVWSQQGIICTGESYKNAVKLTFMNGAELKDNDHLFNASLEGKTRRAIDIAEGNKIDDKAFLSLILEAAKLNNTKKKK